jgi:cobalt/nickel transport system permease protein
MSKGQSHPEPYIDGESALHGLDSIIKTLSLLGLLLFIALIPSGAWAFYLLTGIMIFSGFLLAELPLSEMVKRSLIIELPLILILIPLLFDQQSDIRIQVRFLSWQLNISAAGMERFLDILVKSWCSVLVSILYASVTRFHQFASAMRVLGISRSIVAIWSFMWRYLFLLVNEAQRMLRARSARSGKPKSPIVRTGGSLRWRASVTGHMAGNMLLRSLEKSERVYQSMKARGYDGEIRTHNQLVLLPSHKLFIVGEILIFALFLFTAYQVY